MLIIIHVHFQLQSLEFVNKRVVDYDHVCCEHVVCEHVCCVQVCFDDSQHSYNIHVHNNPYVHNHHAYNIHVHNNPIVHNQHVWIINIFYKIVFGIYKKI